ncbi:hypothetical protein BSFA1_86240 (plasmid) [Burkholderia sp. SFA1]|nr:hypothetical protein BSFA1_86240 [Burkholderia sp. SFA1]
MRPATLTEAISPVIDLLRATLARGAATGDFRADVDALDFYVTLAAMGYYLVSNRFTLKASRYLPNRWWLRSGDRSHCMPATTHGWRALRPGSGPRTGDPTRFAAGRDRHKHLSRPRGRATRIIRL